MDNLQRVTFIWGEDGKVVMKDDPEGRWYVVKMPDGHPRILPYISYKYSPDQNKYTGGIDPYEKA